VVEVDWVYNSMPPVPGRIHLPVGLEAVREFGGTKPSFSIILIASDIFTREDTSI
jgi:hypothetical protein